LAGALGGEAVPFGYEVLEAADIGTLGAEFYRFRATLNLVYGSLGLVQSLLEGAGFCCFRRAVDGVQELLDLGGSVAAQNEDG
jgi:hypothetical protein